MRLLVKLHNSSKEELIEELSKLQKEKSYLKKKINELKQREAELILAKEKAEKSNQLKSVFLMNVSHEIRTPMNGILGFIDLMNEPDLDEEEKRSFIDTVNKSGIHLLNIINDIIEISKIENGDIKLINEAVNTEEIMRYYFNFFKLQAEKKNIEIRISKLIKGKQAYIKTDKQKLDGILMNLIRNAIKFTFRGTIEIGNYIENNRIYFFVSDSGRGIPEDKQEVIFDRFVQVELGNTHNYEGSGIGLSIVKAYIEALNGDIKVKSESGKGSTFLFSFPYIPVSSEYEIREKVDKDKIYQSGHTLLIVEDDEVNFYFLEQILSEEFNLLKAVDGEDAVEKFMDNPEISLILMDIKLPGNYDGLDATRIIREMNQEVPIIAQTAYAMESDKTKALEAGCNDYISKPYSPGNLKSLIRKYYNTVDKSKNMI